MKCVPACNENLGSFDQDGYNCIKCHDQCSGCNGMVSVMYTVAKTIIDNTDTMIIYNINVVSV